MKIIKYGIILGSILLIAGAAAFTSCLNGGHMQSISITPAKVYTAKGTSQQFSATANFSDGTTLDWTAAVDWTADPAGVTFQDASGSHGLASDLTNTNTFTITATDPVNNISGVARLYVVDPTDIHVTPSRPYMANGTTYQFEAIADLYSDGTTTITQDLTSSSTVSWRTSDQEIATVDESGLVTTDIENTGQVRIMVEYDNKTFTTTLTVTEWPVNSITVTPATSTISTGTIVQFTATGNYADGLDGTTQDFTASANWTSSDDEKVVIDESGLATVVAAAEVCKVEKPCEVEIQATDPITGTTGTATVTIIN